MPGPARPAGKMGYVYAMSAGTGRLTNLALAGGSVYVVTLDLPLTYASLSAPAPDKSAGRPNGEIEALSLATGKVKWDTKVGDLPLGAATVSATNAPIAIAGNTVLVPAAGPRLPGGGGGGPPELVAYSAP